MVRDADRYCAACGLPQLVIAETDAGSEAVASPGAEAEGDRTGFTGEGGEIHWRQALKMALLVAIPAGMVCSRMSPLGLIWMLLAAVWVVRLYARRTASSRVTARVGARIGFVTGLLTGWLALAIDCVDLWFERYVRHQGGQIDSDMEQIVAQALEPMTRFQQQLQASAGHAGVQVVSSIPDVKAFFLSPDGRAGMLIGSLFFSLAFMALFAVAGGALGARMAPRLGRPQA